MPKLAVDDLAILSVEAFFAERPELAHLRARKRGDLIIIESGPKGDAIAHARLRRVTKQWWELEIADAAGHWQFVPLDRSTIGQMLDTLTEDFPWVLAPRE